MAKKFSKVLLFTAAAAAVSGAAYYYMKKKDAELMAQLDEDYDDFSDDYDEETVRSYVPLSHENAPEKEAFFTPLNEQASITDEPEDNAEEAVEEFFDEDDEDTAE